MNKAIRLLIVDDSKVFRKIIHKMLEAAQDIEIVGEAADGKQALELAGSLLPDVVLLDVNMPVMDGLTTLKHLMVRRPTPVLMFSAFTKAGATLTFEALRFGAVDFIQKPSGLSEQTADEQSQTLVRKIRLAAAVRVGALRYTRQVAGKDKSLKAELSSQNHYLFGLVAREGGYSSLLGLLPHLDQKLAAGFVAWLWEPAAHVDAFASYLDQYSRINIMRVQDNAVLSPGSCWIASADEQVEVRLHFGLPRLSVEKAPKNFLAGDVLLHSLGAAGGVRSAGIVLSGKGHDGLAGSRRLVQNGGTCMIQSPDNCLCPEMASNIANAFEVHWEGDAQQLASHINRAFFV
ncbi:MAG: chemotaxis protein CheB [Desulfatibacillaceae bacterium]|nr:chemotaxis protein CheB [Desulfatibacillaceae bacterium]